MAGFKRAVQIIASQFKPWRERFGKLQESGSAHPFRQEESQGRQEENHSWGQEDQRQGTRRAFTRLELTCATESLG